MIDFTIKLAGVPIGVTAFFDSTRDFCRDYLTDETPSFAVALVRDDLVREAEHSARENLREGLQIQKFPPQYLETLALYRKIVEHLLAYDIFLFHGSVISVDGQGYLFTAKSGTGKSTHTRLWREYFGDRAVMVNDDKPLLKITDGGVTVCGTPWDGKHHLSTNIEVPLKAICILERGVENEIGPVSAQDALPMLLQQSHRPADPAKMGKYLTLMDKLSKTAGLYRLRCNMEPAAAKVAHEGMKG